MSEQPRRRRRQQMPSDELNREEIRVEKQNPSSISEERPFAIQTSISKPRKKKKKSKQGIVVVIAVFVITLIVGLLAISYFAITANSRQTIVSEVLSTPSPVFELMPTATPTLTPTESPIQSGESTVGIPVIHEEFSIRNGICYGMTLAEAKVIEDKNGFNSFDHSGVISYYGVSIAGIPDSTLNYSADGYDWSNYTEEYKTNFYNHTPVGLIRYDFGRNLSAEQAETIFESINENLTQKYGNPFCTDINDRLLIKTSAPIIDNFLYADWRADRTITGYAEWIVQYADCYVLVSEIAYREKYKDDGTCDLCYRFISYEEMESIFEEIQNYQKQAKEEIANDL